MSHCPCFVQQEAFNQTFGEEFEEREKLWWKKVCLVAVGFGAIATLIYQSTNWRQKTICLLYRSWISLDLRFKKSCVPSRFIEIKEWALIGQLHFFGQAEIIGLGTRFTEDVLLSNLTSKMRALVLILQPIFFFRIKLTHILLYCMKSEVKRKKRSPRTNLSRENSLLSASRFIDYLRKWNTSSLQNLVIEYRWQLWHSFSY